MLSQKAWIISLECEKCVRNNRKLILAPIGYQFKVGCVKCQRHLSVSAERYFVYAGFLLISIREYI